MARFHKLDLCNSDRRDSGVALILVLIFTVLLYAIVAHLVTAGRTDRLTGSNDALIARMDNHMAYVHSQIEDLLLADLASAGDEAAGDPGSAGGGGLGGGGLGGLGDLGGGGGGDGLGEDGEDEADASSESDGSQDAWYEPTAYSDGDITTYVWVEDENAKFNLLTLVSPDDEFAQKSRDRFVRLVDGMREEFDSDVTRSDGERIADEVIDWMRSRSRTTSLPRPPLKSDSDVEHTELSLMLHLDELMLLPSVSEGLFFDQVLDGKLIHGLESVLTIFTSLAFDPGDPEDPVNQRAAAARESNSGGTEAGGEAPTPQDAPAPGDPPTQPEGVGIRININTAPRPVLRCLFTQAEMSDTVLDALVEYRNEVEEEGELDDLASSDYLGFVEEGEEVTRKVFTDVAQLDELDEFMNMPDPTIKEEFFSLVGVDSDVFSIHMASIFVRNEELRTHVMARRRSIMMRVDDGDEGAMFPITIRERRHGLRVKGEDLLDESGLDAFARNDALDDFSQEEKAWNPFLLEFYLPKDQRDRLYSYR